MLNVVVVAAWLWHKVGQSVSTCGKTQPKDIMGGKSRPLVMMTSCSFEVAGSKSSRDHRLFRSQVPAAASCIELR